MKLLNVLRTNTWYEKKSFLIKLFIMTASLSCLLVFSISTIIYYNFQKNSIGIIQNYDEKVLSQLSYNASYMNIHGNTYSSSLFNSENSMQLMFDSIADPFTAKQIMDPLDETLNGMPFVHSVYFYSRKFGLYYAIGPNRGIYKSKDFYDFKIEEIMQLNQNLSFRPFARKMPKNIYAPNETIDIYSYIFTDNSYISSGKINAAVILNVNANWISDTINSLKLKDNSINGSIIVVDKNGIVMADSSKKLFLQNYSDKKYINNVIFSHKQSGSFTTTIDGEKNVVTFVSSDLPDWYYIVTTPYLNFIKPLHKTQSIALTTLLFTLILALLLSFFVSRRLYSPIKSLESFVKQLYGNKQNEHTDINEFNYITGILKESSEKMYNLQKFRQENYNLLKSNFFRGIIKGNIKNSKAIDEGIQKYSTVFKIDIEFFIVVIRIDDYMKFCINNKENDRELLRYAICNISHELISCSFHCESVDMEDDHIVLIVNTSKDFNRSTANYSKQYDICRQIQDNIENFFDISVSISISSLSKDIELLHVLYIETLDASNYRLIKGRKCFITPEILMQINKSGTTFPASKDKILVHALKQNRISDVKKLYFSIIDYISTYSHQNIRFTLTYLFSSVYNTLTGVENNSNLCFQINFTDFCTKLNTLETLEEINNEFMLLFDNISEIIENSKNSKTELIVTKIADYININYMDTNLSVNSLSDTFKLSPDHIGKIFRETLLKTLSEYINEYRIEKAKEILIKSDFSVDEIIGRVGVENKKYFYTLFKKNVGVTPTEFRLKNMGL